MNVLLAEADVPYDQLTEMDDINPYFGPKASMPFGDAMSSVRGHRGNQDHLREERHALERCGDTPCPA